jgi:hypothetical protein
MICTRHHVLVRQSNQGRWDGRNMWHVWDRREMHTGVWWGNLKEAVHLDDLGVNGSIPIKCF